jgi:hypothetical protein
MSSSLSGPSSVRLGISPILQLLVGLAILIWIATQVPAFVREGAKLGGPAAQPKEQKVYVLNPSTGSPRELANLIDQGWRVTHTATAGCPNEQDASHRFLLIVEGPKKEQEWWYVNPFAADPTPAQLQKQLKNGFRITHVSSAATAASSGWTYQTVFVLER